MLFISIILFAILALGNALIFQGIMNSYTHQFERVNLSAKRGVVIRSSALTARELDLVEQKVNPLGNFDHLKTKPWMRDNVINPQNMRYLTSRISIEADELNRIISVLYSNSLFEGLNIEDVFSNRHITLMETLTSGM